MTRTYCDKCGKELIDEDPFLENVDKYPDGYFMVISRAPYKDEHGVTKNLGYHELDFCSDCRKQLTKCLEAVFFDRPFLIPKKWLGPDDVAPNG